LVQTLVDQFSQDLKLTSLDRPIHAIVFLSFTTGVVLIGFHRSFPYFFSPSQTSHEDASLPLEEIAAPLLEEDTSDGWQNHTNFTPSRRAIPRALLLGAVTSVVVRIELLRRILKATECTVSSIEV